MPDTAKELADARLDRRARHLAAITPHVPVFVCRNLPTGTRPAKREYNAKAAVFAALSNHHSLYDDVGIAGVRTLFSKMTFSPVTPSLPQIEINFLFEGERWIARLGDSYESRSIAIVLNGGPVHKVAAQLTSQLLQHGLDAAALRRAVFGGPLALLLDRIIAVKPQSAPKDSQ